MLYVNDNSGSSARTVASVTRFCREHFAGNFSLEVISAEENVERICEDEIPALPMLVRKNPGPVRRLVGNLTADNYLAVGLGVARARF